MAGACILMGFNSLAVNKIDKTVYFVGVHFWKYERLRILGGCYFVQNWRRGWFHLLFWGFSPELLKKCKKSKKKKQKKASPRVGAGWFSLLFVVSIFCIFSIIPGGLRYS
jgi:hypothetical protein